VNSIVIPAGAVLCPRANSVISAQAGTQAHQPAQRAFSCAMACALILAVACSGCRSATGEPGRKPWSAANLFGQRDKSRSHWDEEEKYDLYGEANPDRLHLYDLGPGRIGTTLRTRWSSAQDHRKAEKHMAEGERLYNEAITLWESDVESARATTLFRQASRQFELAADNWRDSALEQDALFMQGEASFFANDYMLANRAYEILVSRYAGTPQLDLVESRRFEIAQYWLSLSRDGAGLAVGDHSRPMMGLGREARRVLHRIRLDDPSGKLADDATLALGNAFMEARRYSDAADAYEDLRRTYPGSRHQFLAHKFELQARLAAYRGPDYDGTDLVKAEDVLKTMLRQFPNECEADRDELAETGGQIRHQLAERDWTMAEYYEGRGENRAATHYYNLVAENYDDTSFGGEAGERIAALGGLPPVPKQKAQWLADLFPVKERNKPLIATGDRESILR
jgi:outer membrane protein assembly factor BamD (BamD/ComL family)